METMTVILLCQVAYAAAGMLYNLVSWIQVRRGRKALSATDPVKGIISMLVVLLVTASYPLAGAWIYRIGWLLLIFQILPGGIIRHVKAIFIDKNHEDYATPGIGVLAASINTLGLFFAILGLLGSLNIFLLSTS